MTALTRAAVDQDLARLRDELACLKKDVEAALALASGPHIDGIFQPGRTYHLHYAQFRCEHLTTDPETGRLLAWGWSSHNATLSNPLWRHRAMTTTDFARWTTDGATNCPTEPEGDPS